MLSVCCLPLTPPLDKTMQKERATCLKRALPPLHTGIREAERCLCCPRAFGKPCQGLQLVFPKAGVALSSSIQKQPFKLLPGVLHKSSPGAWETASNYTEVLRKQVKAQRKVKRRGGRGGKKEGTTKIPALVAAWSGREAT